VLDAIRNDDGEVIGFAKVTRDMTERMQAQQRLHEAQEQLAASQRMEAVGQLSGGIAHDFNNLLMIVLGNLETVEQVAKGLSGAALPRLQRALVNAVRGAQRAAALTQRLLAFSRRQPLDPKPLDVNRFITNIIEFIQPLGFGPWTSITRSSKRRLSIWQSTPEMRCPAAESLPSKPSTPSWTATTAATITR
jgi:signal transduction histidine kinase